jgi:RNA polymerase sigma-70 factor, ECF subfamily
MSSLSGVQHEAELPVSPAAQTRDRELLRQAQHGDRAAYGQLVVAYQDRLYNAVLRLVGDREEARELTQETFTRGLMKLDSFRGEAGPYTWLFRIAINLAISHLRKASRHRVFSLDHAGGNGQAGSSGRNQASSLVERVVGREEPTPLEAMEKRERSQQVLEALGRLDAEARALLVMRDIEGFDYQQMADILAMPLGTLKSKLFRARLALREGLAGNVKLKS